MASYMTWRAISAVASNICRALPAALVAAVQGVLGGVFHLLPVGYGFPRGHGGGLRVQSGLLCRSPRVRASHIFARQVIQRGFNPVS